jgi:hypothetical protein
MNQAEEGQLNHGPQELTDRVHLLEAENTRLQALVCYLVHTNEQLRQQNCHSRLPSGVTQE